MTLDIKIIGENQEKNCTVEAGTTLEELAREEEGFFPYGIFSAKVNGRFKGLA